MLEALQWIALPIGLGLFGFIEPCSVGSSLLFIKSLEGRDRSTKLAQVGTFTLVRAVSMGAIGLLAVWLGTAFTGFQRGAWLVFGALYVLVGIYYLSGNSAVISASFGSMLARLSGAKGAAALGAMFAFNIPACAAPLLFALLAMAAAGGASGASISAGFLSMALFGLALSLPIVAIVLVPRARAALDRLAGFSRRAPRWTGLVLFILGLWSIWFGLFVSPV
jgi:cytochrome c-type biogenesis protein